jgi:hypothetical protein
MKSLKMVVVALVVGSMSFSTMAATLLTKEDLAKDPTKYERLGTVSVTGEDAPMDTKEALSKKADEEGAQYYVIIAGREHGKFSATAEIYKDKQ